MAWSLLLAAAVAALVCAPTFAQYVVKTQDDLERRLRIPVENPAPVDGAPLTAPSCGLTARAWHGQAVPGGGVLAPLAWGTTALTNASGRIAFYAQILGTQRNQGIFTAHGSSLSPIAIGCGSYLGSGEPGTGCGDPTPIGGTFSGFMTGTLGTPALNDAGDVLFLADVHGGASPRGLFLYRGATGLIEKIAAIGDIVSGLPVAAIGPGSLNNLGEVVFLAADAPANENAFIAHWRDGSLRKVVARGDPFPSGGLFSGFVWNGWLPPDGTYVPFAEVPDINDRGTIAFQDLSRGLIVSREGVHERYVALGEPSPAGGAYSNFYAPILNNNDEIAFLGEYRIDPWTIGWFVGRPGRWRKVVSFFTPIDGGQAWGIAVSHNPMQPLDDEGNLLVWADVKFSETVSVPRILLGRADGRLETVVKSGDFTPLGGSLSELNPWPSVDGRRAIIDAGVTGAAGIFSAHFEFLKPPLEVTGLSVVPDPGGVRLAWNMQPAPPAGMTHDVLRGGLGALIPPTPTQCLARDVDGNTVVEPHGDCAAAPGDGCWYLVRAQDACGAGPYGSGEIICFDACDEVFIYGCPRCGDGVLNGLEECEGATPGGKTCQTQNYDGGTLSCSPSCTLDTSACTTICGNGIRRGDEECDGAVQGSTTCLTLGYDGGVLGCAPDCTYDITGCCCSDGTPGCLSCPVCGNGVKEAPQELCDGADLGGQTCASLGWASGTLACNQDCTWWDFSGCVGHLAPGPVDAPSR